MSPLRAAMRKRHRDLVLLLLCNGYRLDLETDRPESVLDEVLAIRDFQILELLLKWGADPTEVSTESVLNTYRTDLIDRFWRAGVDYTCRPQIRDLRFAYSQQAYGWLRHNRTDQRLQDTVDVALLEAVTQDRELPTNLLLWAGADPHRIVPSLGELDDPDAWHDPESLLSSAAAAIVFGKHRLLDALRIETMPDLDAQVARAHDSWTLKKLVALRPPADWSEVIVAFIRTLCSRHSRSSWDARDALRFVESSGGKLTSLSSAELRYVRSQLLSTAADDLIWMLKWLKRSKNCEPAIYDELIRTTAMRQKIEALGIGARSGTPSRRVSCAKRASRRVAERKQSDESGAGA